MRFPFSQPEIERPIDLIVEERRRGEIAELTETYPSVVYGMFNPQDDRKSIIFLFVRLLWALDQIGIGQRVLDQILLWRETWMMPKRVMCADVSECTQSIAVETADFIKKRMDGKPLAQQINEAEDIVQAALRNKEAIIREFQKQEAASFERDAASREQSKTTALRAV